MFRNRSINLRLNSFASFDDAMDMCDLLTQETGEQYTVVSDHILGFTARKVESNKGFLKKDTEGLRVKKREFRQAWRGFIANYS